MPIAEYRHKNVPNLAQSGSAADFKEVSGASLNDRFASFCDWRDLRAQYELWPYNKTTIQYPGTNAACLDVNKKRLSGINLASQDYFSLSKDPRILEAARSAAEEYGVHSSGSSILMGNTGISRRVENLLGDALLCEAVLLYPTGWAAGYGVLKGLARKQDHIVMDSLAHNCLQEGAHASESHLYRASHNKIRHFEKILRKIREKDKDNAIFVVTESLFSMDSDTPNLHSLHNLCREWEAILVVDVAHDFGVFGRSGRSAIEEYGLLGKVDIVMGSFSKTMSSIGGFIASNNARIIDYLSVYSSSYLFSNSISPIQAAVVEAALKILFSEEGEQRRVAVLRNAMHLRIVLEKHGLHCIGRPSPIVPVVVGTEFQVRIANYLCSSVGVLTNVAEYPVVPRGKARLRLQIQSQHSCDEMTAAGDIIAECADLSRMYSDENCISEVIP